MSHSSRYVVHYVEDAPIGGGDFQVLYTDDLDPALLDHNSSGIVSSFESREEAEMMVRILETSEAAALRAGAAAKRLAARTLIASAAGMESAAQRIERDAEADAFIAGGELAD